MLAAQAKKILLVVAGLWVLVQGLSKFAEYWMTKDTPPFLVDMQEHLAKNPRIVARIGEDAVFSDQFNVHIGERDTVHYTFLLNSYKGSLREVV